METKLIAGSYDGLRVIRKINSDAPSFHQPGEMNSNSALSICMEEILKLFGPGNTTVSWENASKRMAELDYYDGICVLVRKYILMLFDDI